MRIALPDSRARAIAWRRGARGWSVRQAGCLVLCVYLVAAVGLTWRLWAGLGTMSPPGDPGPADYDLLTWFMRYTADALAHGHLPALVTTAMNPPRGISLMWNNSLLFPGVVLTPVTLLGGPQVSLTIVMTLGYAGSAAAMCWLLRRHGASVLAGGLGGAAFGFSPAMLNAGIAHYGMQFAVLPPLMIEAVLSILTGRRPLAAGAWLGLLAAAQLFTGEEMLTYVGIVCMMLVAVLAASRPREVRARLRGTAVGLGAAAAVALLICWYALWIQFHGPLAEHGNVWPIAKFGNSVGAFVNPQAGLLIHTASSAAFAASHGANSAEYLAYLGWPLLILVAGVTVRYWRDLRVRAAGVIWAVLELLSLGTNGPLLPFHWLQGVPLLADMLPSRLSLPADGAAAAVLAFGLDLARSSVPRTARPLRAAAPVMVALVAVLPLVPRPMGAIPGAQVPAGWTTVYTRLHLSSGASVLIVPAPYSQQGDAMRWQADTGQPGELVAGWFLGATPAGRAVSSYWGPRFTAGAVLCLEALWKGAPAGSGCDKAVRPALKYWHPAAVVADTSPGTPLGRYLTRLLGKAAIQDGQLLAWRSS